MSDFKTNLVQSADAAARVGVLLVAVALFAAMWESDSTSPPSSEEHWLARRAGISNSVADARDESSKTAEQSRGQVESDSVFKPASMSTEQNRSYPMPAGIAPGEYRVVDSFGMADILRISPEMVSLHNSHEVKSQYVIEIGDRTVYFIRIQSCSAVATALPGSTLQ